MEDEMTLILFHPQLPLRIPCLPSITMCESFTTSPYLRPQDSSSPIGRHLTPEPLAWSDGRCVQEFPGYVGFTSPAGTYSPRDSDTRIPSPESERI